MSRLTIEDKGIRDNFDAEYAKLADLEDIEDELGIDLTLLVDIFKQKFIVKKEKAGAYLEVMYETDKYIYLNINTDCLLVDLKNKCLVLVEENNLCEDEDKLYFKDYGTIWGLTKEELEWGKD